MESRECFLQWNLQGMSSSKEDLLKIIDDHKPSVIALQETYFGNDFMINLRGYQGICKQGHFNKRFFGGVALYIHQSCPFRKITLDSPYQIVAAEVQIPHYRRITVASLYLPPRKPFNIIDFNRTLAQLPSPLILLGDFNAHHPMWGNSGADTRGNTIETILNTHDLTPLNTGASTHGSGSAIDLTLVTTQLAPDFRWFPGDSVLSSDHFPLFTVLETLPATVELPAEVWNYKKGKWKSYHDDPMWKTMTDLPVTDPNLALEQFYQTLNTLGDRWIPKYCKERQFAKPWWNKTCRTAFYKRERLYRIYKQSGQNDDKLLWQEARREASRCFDLAKETSWREYVGKLNIHTPSSEVWRMVGSIRGRPALKVNILESGTQIVSEVADVAEVLADSFAAVSSNANYPPDFTAHKAAMESTPFPCDSENNEPFNLPFSLSELENAIKGCKVTAPGPDGISNLMFKNMPDCGRIFLLSVFNLMWEKDYFPPDWHLAHVIPIPKPGKDHSHPQNYRPIALTSCLCKLFERMINNRLVEFLENGKLLAKIQCGFRRNRSAIDHLVRFDTYVRKAFARGENVYAVFFDLEKAYDTAWRFGILRDLSSAGICGHLLSFVANFLDDRRFCVKLPSLLSTEREQQTGIPQGSTLSVTLFGIKMNSLAEAIPHELFSSLFVDDVLIACAGSDLHLMQDKIQRGVNAVASWASLNGSKFSASKTKMMCFYPKVEPAYRPVVKLNQTTLSMASNMKFLGLLFDPKLTYQAHITQLKSKCQKSLNLLKSVSSQNWGADQETLIRLYRSLIRSKIDYGCIVYGAASRTALSTLDTIANDAMRIASGAFKSTPIANLNVVLNEPTLKSRRKEMLLRYYYKLKCHFLNPAYPSVHNSCLLQLFRSHNSSAPVIIRAQDALEEYNMPRLFVIPFRTPSVFSWMLMHPTVDTEFTDVPRKELPSPALQQIHHERASNLLEYEFIYTDGSKSQHGVGSAAVYGARIATLSLPAEASILTAELHAIRLGLAMISESTKKNFVIFTDSLSSVECLSKGSLVNHFTWRICEQIHNLQITGKSVVLSWIPSHVGISGNERADVAAKRAAGRPSEFAHLPYRDLDSSIRKRTMNLWAHQWDSETRYLKDIKPIPGSWDIPNNLTRRERVVVNRLRLGHTRLTHGFLFEDEFGQRPICRWCNNALLTVQHLLLSCPNHDDVRRELFPNSNLTMKLLLDEKADLPALLAFLRRLDILEEI